MNILQQIVAFKKKEVSERKSLYPVKLLERSIYFPAKPLSLKSYLARPDLSGIIAEFKRRSPSAGDIHPFAPVETTTLGYMQAGASALSVLTDQKFFGGSSEDLSIARKFNFCPILRKDFMVDPYQVIEAKSIGADVILLIASILSKQQITSLTSLARSLQLEVLLELHSMDEIAKIPDDEVIIGVNNRDLTAMKTDLQTSFRLLPHLPASAVKVSESGIHNADSILQLKELGYSGFLIGEYFMRHTRPEQACKQLIQQLISIKSC